MNKMLTGFIFIVSPSVFAERIDGPANVRQTINGEVILSLNDNVKVDIGENKNGWYKIAISVTLTEEQFKNDILKRGAKLYNGRNEEIGVVLKDFSVSSTFSGGGAPGVPKWYGGEIYAYTFKSNIRPESIVEPVISELINSNKTDLTLSVFKEHMKYFGYVDGLRIRDMDKYKTYMIYESIIDDPSPLDRIRLVFENENLIAVIHSRALTLTGFEMVPIERGRKLTLIKKFSPQDKETFIEKNKQTYSGID